MDLSINWYSRFVNKISYRIDREDINKYLLKECQYAAHLPEDKINKELKQLLLALSETSENEKRNHWLEKYTIEKNVLEKESHDLLFSEASLNRIRFINKYFIQQNQCLKSGGYFVSWFQTSLHRKLTIFNQFPPVISHLIYFFDFSWHRVCPKLPVFKNIYFFITKGQNRVYPRSEILGRLYCCGFKVVNEQYINNKYYIIAKKTREPYNDPHPSYGPLIRLKRIGKDGKLFNVYKFRTMHAYSEYLQSYIYENNNLDKGGKFANDYRVSSWGKIMRKYWLDELPMFLNLLKGDMKLVGVRPLSKQYFSLYSTEIQTLRTKTKPGLLPPFYVDMPKTIEEVQESERIYVEAYLEKPFRTDWRYFRRIIRNIVMGGKRSK